MDARVMPAQAYARDMPISDLNTAELLLVATTRLYMENVRGEEACGFDWYEGLVAAGVPPCAVVAFGVFLEAIAKGYAGGLDVRCPLCPSLGRDEGNILQAIGLLQQKRFGEAHAILGIWLSPLDQSAMISPVAHAAFGCANSGLFVPWRCAVFEMYEHVSVLCRHADEWSVH